MKMNRRILLASVSALVLAPAAQAQEIDVKALMEPNELGDMELGKPEAPVTIVEYASASCPHCADFHNNVLPLLKTEYIDTGKVRLIFREFPHNDQAMGAFMLARCAPKEKYFPLMDVYFKTQQDWVTNPLEGLKKIALQAGFTEASFNECLGNEKVARSIFDIRTKAEGFGVDGIPTFFINGTKMEGEKTMDAFKAILDPLLPAAG